MMAAAAPVVQLFGRRDSRDTRRALRFFQERRVPVSFVDLALRPPAPAELRRFAQRFGASALLDTGGRRYRDLGLQWLALEESELLERLLEDPELLRLPLGRAGNELSVGVDEDAWRAWLRDTRQ
jgi:arsenate reductase-like glutaredoxin family protein